MQTIRVSVPMAACLFLSLGALPAAAQSADMTFFITSEGPGKGGDLGGLDGADAYCQQLAAAVGAAARPGVPISRHRATMP